MNCTRVILIAQNEGSHLHTWGAIRVKFMKLHVGTYVKICHCEATNWQLSSELHVDISQL